MDLTQLRLVVPAEAVLGWSGGVADVAFPATFGVPPGAEVAGVPSPVDEDLYVDLEAVVVTAGGLHGKRVGRGPESLGRVDAVWRTTEGWARTDRVRTRRSEMTDELWQERVRTLRVAQAATEARRRAVAAGAPEGEVRLLVDEETAAWAAYRAARRASMGEPEPSSHAGYPLV